MKTMNPEERFDRIEHLLEFLAVSIQSHDAQIAENSRHLAETRRLVEENSRQIAAHSGQIDELTDLVLRIGRIAEEQARRMDESQMRIDERMNTLVELQARTDEHVSNPLHAIERRLPGVN